MPTEVVGVKEVMKGLSFIDEDMYKRIKTAIDPLMRQVEAMLKVMCLVIQRYYLAGLSQYHPT
jgi:hypothetical protein